MNDMRASTSWRFHASANACNVSVVTSGITSDMIVSVLSVSAPVLSGLTPNVLANRRAAPTLAKLKPYAGPSG
jgi:hypothetical protein